MHTSELIILSRIRQQEITEEFKRIHFYRKNNAKHPKMINRVLKSLYGLLAATLALREKKSSCLS
jgi:hypothetical protein